MTAPDATHADRAAVKASRTFTHIFWNGDTDACCALLAPDFVWVAAQEEQYNYDVRQFRAAHKAIFQTMPRAILMQEEYQEILHEGRLHVVIGQIGRAHV